MTVRCGTVFSNIIASGKQPSDCHSICRKRYADPLKTERTQKTRLTRISETASFFVDVKCILELISLYTAFYKFIFNSHCLLTVYEYYVLVSRDGNYARIGNDVYVYVCATVAVSVNFKNLRARDC